MPFARISIPAGKPADYRKTVGDVVYEAMLPTLKAPEGDRFQVITEHAAADLILDPDYLGISRTKDAVIVQLTMNEGRSVEQKKGFFKAVADGLHDRLKIRREDVFINLVEVKKENWSFGNGIAQYA
jgi:phenylpyruvate tautomerase PptA (4-oxalocrotonate tautomerase family)